MRQVVLFDRTATIGYGPGVHVSCNGAVHPLVLFERSGSLWIRPQGNGRIDTEATMVPMGESVELMNVSFVVQPWTGTGNRKLETRD